MEFASILAVVFGFVLTKLVLEQRAAARRDNLRLLEEALKNPALDRASLENLSWQLTGKRPMRASQAGAKFLSMVLAVGWLALFAGIGIWIAGEMIRASEARVGGILTAICGFGLVTYPFALRELEARKQA